MTTKAKDFSGIKTGRPGRVTSIIESATGQNGQQATASPEEVKKRKSALKTQGRKGCKAVRINMAFTPENHKFIKVYASSTGQTMTEACNQMLDYARENKKFLDRALTTIKGLMNDLQEDQQALKAKAAEESGQEGDNADGQE